MRLLPAEYVQQLQAINVLSDPGHIGGPVIVPSCTQVVLTWTLTNGKQAKNVMYGRYAGAFALTQTDANSMLTQIASGAGWTGLAAYMPTTSSLTSVSFRDMNTANNAFITSNGAAVPGTSASPALPDEVAAVITMRTAKTGQANRGRVYNPAWATNALGAGGVILAAAVTALGTWATNNLLAAFPTRGLTAVIGQPARASYTGTTGTLHPARSATSIAITSAVVRDNHWDTIRRRGLK